MKPMLAATPKNGLVELRYPLYASPKLDGVRGVIIKGVLHSRSLKLFPNPHVHRMFSSKTFDGLDGEIIVGPTTAKDAYRVTQGAVARLEGSPEAVFYAFDLWDSKLPFEKRLEDLRTRDLRGPDIVSLPQHRIENDAELFRYEQDSLDLGYEGLILRAPEGLYKFGRSTMRDQGMVKLKRFVDGEAEILAVEEEMENTNEKVTNELGRGQRSTHQAGLVPKGRAGTLCVRDVGSKVEFRIGTGLSDEDKANFWRLRRRVVGRVVKYKHFPVGAKDLPRHPVYLGMREPWDT